MQCWAYITDRAIFDPFFFSWVSSIFSKLQEIQIAHLKAQIEDIYIQEGQGHSTFRDRQDPLIVKKQTFYEKWAWQALEDAIPLS